jgi:hypothetical protein
MPAVLVLRDFPDAPAPARLKTDRVPEGEGLSNHFKED